MTNSEDSVSDWLKSQSTLSSSPYLSVVVPAYNEQRRVPSTLLDMIDFLDQRKWEYEIIVVDDGSNDETSEVVSKFEKVRAQVRLIRLPKNEGKGHAVRVGMLNARGERVMFADADGATPFEEVDRLLSTLHEGNDIAIGSRALYSHETQVKTKWYRKYLGRIFNLCVNMILLPGISDTQCGFKLFTSSAAKDIFKKQRSDGFGFDVEILYLAKKSGLKIKEVPINWTNVPGSKVNLVTDSLKMFFDIVRFRYWHR